MSLYNLMQESAQNHASLHQFGYYNLIKDNKFWVLSRLSLEINYTHEWGIKSFLKPGTKMLTVYFLTAIRFFTLLENKILSSVSTSCMLIDMKNMRSCRLDKLIIKNLQNSEKKEVKNKSHKIYPSQKGAENFFHQIKYSDLEVNERVY